MEKQQRNPWEDKYFIIDGQVSFSIGIYADTKEEAIKKAKDLVYKLEGQKTVEFLGDKDLDYINFPDFDDDIFAEEEEYRICSICGERMVDGYCYADGTKYYCSSKCLHEDFTDKEWEEICDNDKTSYWTQWY